MDSNSFSGRGAEAGFLVGVGSSFKEDSLEGALDSHKFRVAVMWYGVGVMLGGFYGAGIGHGVYGLSWIGVECLGRKASRERRC